MSRTIKAEATDEEFERVVQDFLRKGLITPAEAAELLGQHQAQHTLSALAIYASENRTPEQRKIIEEALREIEAANAKAAGKKRAAAPTRPKTTLAQLAREVYGAQPGTATDMIPATNRGGVK